MHIPDEGFISTLIGGILFSCLSPYTSDTNTLITPANTITQIGFIFVFRSITTHMAKINTMTHFVPVKVIVLLPQKAVIRIKIPADAIIATTAGRSERNTPCSISILRYFKYNFANTVTIIQDGKIHPSVATTAPGIPAIFSPTKVAELTAIGPGVICDIVIRSVNSDIVSHPWSVTTCP